MNAPVNSMIVAEPRGYNMIPINEMERMAEAVAKSGLFGIKTIDQAMALMLIAQAEGQHPATAAQEYDVIQGRPARKTHSVLARFQSAGGSVKWNTLNDKEASATFTHPRGGSVEITWTIEMARIAKLSEKDNWKHYPRAMLRARCIAEGVRTVFPAATGGMLVVEEAQDLDGRIIEGEVTRTTTATELQAYPEEQFAANLPKWLNVIASGKKSADDIIAMVQTKGTLTDEQIAQIREPIAEPGAAG